jgi:peptidyl-prolyl cis-trans isomerase B (cyclophilin B)
MIKLTTSIGEINIRLDKKSAPESSQNFEDYVRDGHYDGTIFHRVIPGFMVQGGGFDSGFREKATRAPVRNEANNGLKNKRGTLAMARTMDPHSATAQFFINVVDNDFLDFQAETLKGWGYAVFGQVVDGMDVVDRIVAAPTGRKGHHDDVPLDTILIEKAELISE